MLTALVSAFHSIAYADLHRHLDGSLRPSTVRELAAQNRCAVPPQLGFTVGMGLQAALSRFAFLVGLLSTTRALCRVASEICEDAAAEGVSTLELRFAPQLHGIGRENAVDAVLEGIAGRAGLLLCGLYGEPPEVLDALVTIARARRGVVGIDLAGGPSPTDTYHMQNYAAAFVRASELGLGTTVHAGEGRPPQEIRVAIEDLHARRIGHGTTLLQDAAVLDLVLSRSVTIEVCLTSNLHTGAIARIAEHPLPKMLRAGVSACINTDNTLLSETTAAIEHERALGIPGMTPALLERAIGFGHQGKFSPSSVIPRSKRA